MFMNEQESDILQTVCQELFINQRLLAEASGHLLGVVNRPIKTERRRVFNGGHSACRKSAR